MSQAPLQDWNAEAYARNARFVADLGTPLIGLLGLKPGERVLDLGCGDGALTRKLMDAGATVIGVDASEPQISAARVAGIDARLMDAHDLGFRNEFDAVFTNAVLHWITDPPAVVRGVRKALKTGGRFVGEFGGHTNVAAICTALLAALKLTGQAVPDRQPWYFPTEAEFRNLLVNSGFEVESLQLFPRPTPLPTDMRGWLETFAGPFVKDLPAEVCGRVFDEATALLAPSLRDPAGRWTADYVRLRFVARAIEGTSTSVADLG
jgi:trans-aconitate methyltransferase